MGKREVAALAFAVLSAERVGAAEMDVPIVGAAPAVAYVDEAPISDSGWSGLRGSIEGSHNRGKTDLFDIDNSTWALRGTANVDVGGGFNIQADLDYGRSQVEDFDFNRFGGAAHAYYRPVEDYALGVFGQASRFGTDFFNDRGLTGIDDSMTDTMGGIEGAWFSELATLYGQAGYGKVRLGDEDADHYMGRLGVRYFLSDNVRLDAEGTLNRLSYSNVDLDVNTVKAVGNFRPEGTPVSFFAGYRFDQLEPSFSGISLGSEKNHSVLAGLRLHFGTASLKDEERSGPVWSSTTLLP